MTEAVVDQRIDYVGGWVVPLGSVIDQQEVEVRVLVEETRKTTFGPLVLEERKIETEERVGCAWGRDPSLFHSLVSRMVHSIPTILPDNKPSVAHQVSTYINTIFLQPSYFFFSAAGLQFTYRIHLHTTHRFDDYDFFRDDDFFHRVEMPIQQQQQQDEDNDDQPPTTIEFESLPIKSYTVTASAPGGCCAVCLEDFIQGAKVSELPCSHIFHTDCILPWLKRNTSCPTCRFHISSSSS